MFVLVCVYIPYVFSRICVDKIIFRESFCHVLFLEPMRIRELDFLSVDILMYSFMGLHLFVMDALI